MTGSGYSPEGEILENGSAVAARGDPALRRLLEIAALCNDARLEGHEGWHIHGSSTEGALLAMARKGGADIPASTASFERLHEIAFTSGRKRMAVVVRETSGELWMFVKGSPEALLALCSRVLESDGERRLGSEERERLLARAHELGERGHRILAFAFRSLESGREPDAAERDLTWVGLAGLEDPPRAGVRDAISRLRGAGIRTVMITGDQKGTAMAVARELEIAGPADLCIDSGELAALVRERRWEDVRRTAVFARVSPEDKLSIVRALKAAGHVVAMTGDGINDAPALKASDIGIAIGSRAADVAREASDLVMTSGDYGTLPAAVAEGRRIYANIRRSVHFLLLCSLSTIGVMLASVVANLPLPMSPLQVLWLNLVVHIFPALALVVIPGEADLLRRPPRDPHEPLLTWRATGVIALRSCVVAAAVLWLFTTGGNRDGGPRNQTLAMATLALALLAQTFAALSERRPFWTMTRSLTPPFWLALAGGLGLQALAVFWRPLAAILPTAQPRRRQTGFACSGCRCWRSPSSKQERPSRRSSGRGQRITLSERIDDHTERIANERAGPRSFSASPDNQRNRGGSRIFLAVFAIQTALSCDPPRGLTTAREQRSAAERARRVAISIGSSETKNEKRIETKTVLKKEKVMKKVLGILAVAIILVAAFPMTASAGNVKPGCGGIFLRPCPLTMPPVVTGGGSNGTHSGGGSSTGSGTSTGRGTRPGSRTLPPNSLPPAGAR